MANKESLDAVATDLGMSRQQVRQLEARHSFDMQNRRKQMEAIIMRSGGAYPKR
jgi:DNA-directed RNA polymerase sigma subunit (sigma70/sigma32)